MLSFIKGVLTLVWICSILLFCGFVAQHFGGFNAALVGVILVFARYWSLALPVLLTLFSGLNPAMLLGCFVAFAFAGVHAYCCDMT